MHTWMAALTAEAAQSFSVVHQLRDGVGIFREELARPLSEQGLLSG